MKSKNGSIREWVGTISDIHEQKQAQEALRIGEERLRLAAETTSLGIWDADLISGFLEWTGETREILGLLPDTPALLETFLARIHPDDLVTFDNKLFVDVPGKGFSYRGTFRIICADTGEVCWISSHARIVLDENGQSIRKIGTIRDVTEQRLALGRGLRDAISRNQIMPFYQPKVCLSTGRIVGLEALARWRHPEKGILTPNAFGAVFDNPELASAVCKRLVGKIASDMGRWLDVGIDFGRIAFNLSSMEFNQPDLADEILRILTLVKVPTKHFAIEVTEKVLLDGRSGLVSGTLEKFHQQGV